MKKTGLSKGKEGAPYGNKNAGKWTPEEAQKFVNAVFTYIKKHKDCCSLEEACCELDQYEKVLNYLIDKYSVEKNEMLTKDLVDFNPIKKGLGILKNRLIKLGLTNKHNSVMSIFVLKVNHGMIDKSVHEVEVSSKKINLSIDGENTDLSL